MCQYAWTLAGTGNGLGVRRHGNLVPKNDMYRWVRICVRQKHGGSVSL